MTDTREKAKELVRTWLEDFDITDEKRKNDALESRITQALLEARQEALEEAAGIADNVPCETVEKKRLAASIAQAIRLKEE